MKKAIQDKISKYRDVFRLIKDHPRFQWNRDELSRLHTEIEEAIAGNEFIGKWLILDVASLKKTYNESLSYKLKSLHSFDAKVQALHTETEKTLVQYNGCGVAVEPVQKKAKGAKKSRSGAAP